VTVGIGDGALAQPGVIADSALGAGFIGRPVARIGARIAPDHHARTAKVLIVIVGMTVSSTRWPDAATIASVT
jgi:hypothetical protein